MLGTLFVSAATMAISVLGSVMLAPRDGELTASRHAAEGGSTRPWQVAAWATHARGVWPGFRVWPRGGISRQGARP